MKRALAALLLLLPGCFASPKFTRPIDPSLGALGIYTQDGNFVSRGEIVDGLEDRPPTQDLLSPYFGLRYASIGAKVLAMIAGLAGGFMLLSPTADNDRRDEGAYLIVSMGGLVLVSEGLDLGARLVLNSVIETYNDSL
jgi:hypothetical protein